MDFAQPWLLVGWRSTLDPTGDEGARNERPGLDQTDRTLANDLPVARDHVAPGWVRERRRGQQIEANSCEIEQYVENDWPNDDPRLVAYTHPVGEGEVLYISLGHCCGKYDRQPIQEIAEVVRGSWENPTYMELLRRGLRWAKKTL